GIRPRDPEPICWTRRPLRAHNRPPPQRHSQLRARSPDRPAEGRSGCSMGALPLSIEEVEAVPSTRTAHGHCGRIRLIARADGPAPGPVADGEPVADLFYGDLHLIAVPAS